MEITRGMESAVKETAKEMTRLIKFRCCKNCSKTLNETEISKKIIEYIRNPKLEQMEAIDFFEDDVKEGINGLCEITADTTNDELKIFVVIVEQDADEECNTKLSGTYETLKKYRDELKNVI